MTKPLVTMAIFKTQWNDRRDFVDNFKPFVVEHLHEWPPADPVEPAGLQGRLRESVALDLPIGVIDLVLTRLTRDGLLQRSEGKRWVVPEKLDDEPDLATDRERARNEMDDLAERVAAHARDHHELLEWTADDAMAAIERFLDSLGADFLYQHRRGAIQAAPTKWKHATAVVQSFARHASAHDTRGLDLLAQAVYGGLLAAALRYKRPEDSSKKLDKLVVYLDTAVVLHLLGICVPQMGEAAHELKGLLSDHNVTVRMFEHNYVEVCNILDSTASNLHSSRSKATYTTSHLGRTSREVLDFFIATKKTPADVEIVKTELSERLREARIEVVEAPDHETLLTLDETKLADVLDELVRYQSASTRDTDVDSITAIHRLRNGKAAEDLSRCPAVFVTTNTALVRASRRYFRSERLNGGVPQTLADLELTTQLWIRTPGAHPDLPRKLLIADSFAALNPGQKFWDKYLKIVDALKEEGQVSDTQITAFLFSTNARMALLDATFGDAEELTAETLLEALSEVETELARPRVDAAEAKATTSEEVAAKSAGEVTRLQAELGDLQAEQAEKDERIKALEKGRAQDVRDREQVLRDRAHNRKIASSAGAAFLGAGAVAVVLVTAISQLVATIGCTVLVAASAALLAWGWQKKDGGFAKGFITVGALLAVPAAFWSFAERKGDSTPVPGRTITAPGARPQSPALRPRTVKPVVPRTSP